jgi:hypothetical protein
MRWPALPGGHLGAHSDGDIALGLAKPICQIRRGELGGLAATPASVKGFRTPASHWREDVHGGRRPKTLNGLSRWLGVEGGR